LKNQLVTITFEHGSVTYIAIVNKHSPSAIILPNKTVLRTNTAVYVTGKAPFSGYLKNTRSIFNHDGTLLPITVFHKPSDWEKPIHFRFPVVFAKEK
jgi:hypothetical protein